MRKIPSRNIRKLGLLALILVGAVNSKVEVAQAQNTGKDSATIKERRRNFSDLIRKMLRANGFEISYETVFGNKVVAGFSALGMTRQFQAMKKDC